MRLPLNFLRRSRRACSARALPIALCAAVSTSAFADGVVDVLGVSNARLLAAQESQQLVDGLADETVDLIQQYKALNKEIEALRVNNAQIQAKIQDQLSEIAEIETSIVGVAGVSQQIPFLLQKMVDGLENFVDLDVPFLMDEREKRLADIRSNMTKGNQPVSENFRQVLEAYKIENEYGRKIQAYKASIDFNGDGQTRTVDIFRVGRIALLYKTEDGTEVGRWNQQERRWEALDASEWSDNINIGIRIARNQAVKDILQLPIQAPETAQ